MPPRWRQVVRVDRRRRWLVAALLGSVLPVHAQAPLAEDARRRVAARALALRDEAVRLGDQPYGAVVVRGGSIVGEGVSAVVRRGDPDAHAERIALADALARLQAPDLAGCILVGSARACSRCETEAARLKVAFMFYGADATPAGVPVARTPL